MKRGLSLGSIFPLEENPAEPLVCTDPGFGWGKNSPLRLFATFGVVKFVGRNEAVWKFHIRGACVSVQL